MAMGDVIELPSDGGYKQPGLITSSSKAAWWAEYAGGRIPLIVGRDLTASAPASDLPVSVRLPTSRSAAAKGFC
jgi:aconitase B